MEPEFAKTGEAPAARQPPPAAEADDGVDVSLIRWFLTLTPGERLDALQGFVDATQAPGRKPAGNRGTALRLTTTGNLG